MTVTDDADCGRVYSGEVPVICDSRASREDPFLSSPFREKVRKALDLISPLTLTDPESPRFAPEGCRTLHDIIRFCHERAMHEMFSLGKRGSSASKGARRLRTTLPLVLYLLDISDGSLRCPRRKGEVAIEEIGHAGLRSFWSGMSHPDIHWSPELLHIDWERLEQVTSGGIMSLNSPLLASFAILSHDYMNLSIRFGYHFAVVDSLCSESGEESYVLFSFKGGGSAHAGIMLRVLFLIEILRHYGFKINTRGDLVEAECAHCSAETARTLLAMLGALLGCTRLLDYVLHDESSVAPLVQRFLAGDYRFAHLREGQAVKGVY
jgi:pyruvate,water dikinase